MGKIGQALGLDHSLMERQDANFRASRFGTDVGVNNPIFRNHHRDILAGVYQGVAVPIQDASRNRVNKIDKHVGKFFGWLLIRCRGTGSSDAYWLAFLRFGSLLAKGSSNIRDRLVFFVGKHGHHDDHVGIDILEQEGIISENCAHGLNVLVPHGVGHLHDFFSLERGHTHWNCGKAIALSDSVGMNRAGRSINLMRVKSVRRLLQLCLNKTLSLSICWNHGETQILSQEQRSLAATSRAASIDRNNLLDGRSNRHRILRIDCPARPIDAHPINLPRGGRED
mmetsp:Transcript_16370/g.33731  ORF Transcript_16370/g.33731 Transcript_16370/m.33731 type:complete len:282 (+) Transcript_16370:627-1472(+)